jgi:signal transduction histidine kinase/ActR/RegA family two-component response regulator
MSISGTRANLVRRYLFTLLLSMAAGFAQSRLWPFLTESIPFVALPAVVAAAWFGGIGPGQLATFVPLAIAAWLIGPRRVIETMGPAGAVSVGVFVLTAVLICLTTRQLRRYARDQRGRRLESDRLLRRSSVLQAVAGSLSAARTSADVTKACASELMHATGAIAATVVVVVADSPDLEVVEAFGYDTSITGRVPLSSNSALATSLRQHGLVVMPQDSAPVAAFDADTFLRQHEAFAIIPLVASARALGVVTLGFDQPRGFEDDEREYLLEAGQYAGRALERARQYETAERARVDGEAYRVRADAELQERRRAEEAHRESEARYRTLAARTHRLYSLSAALSEAITLEAVATAVVHQGRSVVGAAAGTVALCAGDDGFETLYAEDYPPAVVEAWHRFSAEPGLCTTAAVMTRAPVLVGSFSDLQAQYPRSAAAAADGGFTSAVSLPLLVDNRPIGVLSFHFTVPVNFDPEYQALLTSVAQHAAQAIDRARLYETTQRARVDAEAANQAKDDFLSIVSHELRTPLNAILGWGAMLRDGSLDGARVERATEAIVNNASRQAHLIDDLLEGSRIVAGRVSLDLLELDLADIVRGAVEAMLPVAAQREVELRIDQLPRARVKADPHRLAQVFANLLANAVKFTPAGGRVTIDSAAVDGTVRVRVTDTGCGIEPDVLPYIFERFRQGNNTTTRSVGGLGLGLFIARRLVEAFQGQVVAESAGKGAGATFTVTLPLVGASVLEPEASPHVYANGAAPTAVRSDLSNVHVLVVDNEPDAREMMSSALFMCGATVTTAGSAREALERLVNAHYDVLLADLAMPEDDGYELIRRIRTYPNAGIARLPAAAVTACAREDERQRALAAGFDLHLAKPIAPSSLAETVARLARVEAANG